MESRTGNDAADKALQEYETAVLELCAQAMGGKIKRGDFRKEYLRIANHYTRLLFVLAGADMENKEANAALDKMLKQNGRSVKKITADVYKGKYNVE